MNITVQCSSGDDDAYEIADGSAFAAGGSTIEIVSDSDAGTRTWGGFRFPSVAVSDPAKVRGAWLQILLDGAGVANLDISAEADVTPDDFGTTPNVVDRVLTVASVAWVQSLVDGAWHTSPDIRAVIQELMSEPGWASGNPIMLILVGRSDTGQSLSVFAYNFGAGEFAAKLILDVEPATALISGFCGRLNLKRPIFRR
jgi:hypothetical protein